MSEKIKILVRLENGQVDTRYVSLEEKQMLEKERKVARQLETMKWQKGIYNDKNDKEALKTYKKNIKNLAEKYFDLKDQNNDLKSSLGIK